MTTATDQRPHGDPWHPDRGLCPVCGDRVPLTDHGMVRVHLEPLGGVARWGRAVCKGSSMTPARREP